MLYFFGLVRRSNDSCRGPLRPLMSRPNLNLNDFMGLFRSGFLACLVVGSAFAQQPAPAPAPGLVPDTNAPVIPQPEPTPGVDPSLVQPGPTTPDLAAPATNTVKKAKKPAAAAGAAALPTLRGTLGSIDKTNMTIVIHGKSKDETLSVTSKTRVFADAKPAILSDAKEGENVVAEYRNTKEKTKEALTLRFGGGNAASDHKADKTEVKPATKKTTTKATAAAKKKKKPAKSDAATPAPADAGITPLPGTPEPAIPTPGAGTPVPQPGTPGPNP